MIETRRYQAIVLRDLGRLAESEAAIRSAATSRSAKACASPC